MAIVEVKVPQLSESVAEATLLQWKKKPGEAVAIDEILIEIETDKVVLEVPAPAAGVLAEIVQADGGTRASAEQVIATHRHRRQGRRRCARGGCSAAPAAAAAAAAPLPPRLPAAPRPAWPMPAAAKLMADNSLAAGSVAGTGKDGRVTKGDVLGALAARRQAGAAGAGAVPAAAAAAPSRCRPSPAPPPRTWATAPSSACR